MKNRCAPHPFWLHMYHVACITWMKIRESENTVRSRCASRMHTHQLRKMMMMMMMVKVLGSRRLECAQVRRRRLSSSSPLSPKRWDRRVCGDSDRFRSVDHRGPYNAIYDALPVLKTLECSWKEVYFLLFGRSWEKFS